MLRTNFMRSFLGNLGIFVAAVCVVFGVHYFLPGVWHYFDAPEHAQFLAAPMIVLVAPGYLVVVFSLYFLGYNPFPGGALQGWEFILGIFLSWVWWKVCLPRLLKFVGLWNPFKYKYRHQIPWILKSLIRIRDWWEQLTLFGKQPTGNWAGILEMMSMRYSPGQIFLGRPRFKIGLGMLRPVGIETEKHMVTIAATGAGKSTGGLIPNLCVYPGSMLCIDPKGELATITAGRRGGGGGSVQGLGQDVFVLDPFGITDFVTASYNPFDEMALMAQANVDAPIAYAAKIAEALVPIASKDPYWDRAARAIIAGLILHVFEGPAEHRNLVRVRRFLMEGPQSYTITGLEADDDERNETMEELLALLKRTPDGPYQESIGDSVRTVEMMPPNQRGSVLSVAQDHTAFLNFPEIKKVVLRSDFLLSNLKSRLTSVYLSVPLNAVTGPASGWLRMFILLLIDMMYRSTDRPKDPILLAIDEFPSLGKLEGIEVVAPTMRSYGVRMWVVGQDIEQFQAVYPKTWGGFIGGAEAVQIMGIKHPQTVDWVVERLGTHLVTKGKGKEKYQEERDLLDANQVSQILHKSLDNQIIWRGDRRPMLLKIAPYFKYLPYWYYDPTPGRRESLSRAFWRFFRKGSKSPARVGNRRAERAMSKPPGPFEPPKPPAHPKGGAGFTVPPAAPPAPPKWLHNLLQPKSSFPPVDPSHFDKYKLPDPIPGARPKNYHEFLRENGRLDKLGLPMWEFSDLPELFGPNGSEFRHESLMPKSDAPEPTKPPQSKTPTGTPPKTYDNRAPLPMEVVNALKLSDTDESGNPLEELDNLIGLEAVRDQVEKTLALIKVAQAKKKAGMPVPSVTHHLVFTGNPGTGKTTVARLIGRIYREHGLLKKGHFVETDRSGLVAEYLGQTARETMRVLMKALDGVLFIDEAYELVVDKSEKDYGHEAISTLLKFMEDHRDRLVVIVAGYKDEMQKFLKSNTGLESRFRTTIEFPDFSAEDLVRILRKDCGDQGCQMSMDAQVKAATLIQSLMGKERFGNARTIRNLFEQCLERQAVRINRRNQWGIVDLKQIEADDVPDIGEFTG